MIARDALSRDVDMILKSLVSPGGLAAAGLFCF
jgi:hypothetical protein